MTSFRKYIKMSRVEKEEYVNARREVDRVKRREKENTCRKIGRQLEVDLLGARKLIQRMTKNYKEGSTPPAYAVKNEEGLLLISLTAISRR